MASAGTVTLNLDANSVKLIRELQKAQNQTRTSSKSMSDNFTKAFSNIAKASAVALGAITAMTIAATKRGLESVDAQAKLASQLNTTSESMATLQRAGELSGVAMDKISTSSRQLNVALGKASQGGNAQAAIFKRLDLSAKNLAEIPLDERILKINEAIRKNIPAVQQASVAAEIFGARNSTAMMSLDAGTMERASQEAKLFGLALNDIDAAKVESANDSMLVFSSITQSASQKLAIAAAGPLKAVADAIKKAWVETDNFGLSAVDFESKFANAVATALESTASLIRFFEGRGEVAQFGLIGYMLFGKKGAVIGAAIGEIFSRVRQELRLLGVGVDDDAAKLARFNERIEETTQALKAAGERSARGQNVDREISILNRQLELLNTKTEELRLTMSDDAWSDFSRFFEESNSAASGFAKGLDTVAASIRNSIGAIIEVTKSDQGMGDEFGIEAADQYQTYIDELVAINASWLNQLDRQLMTQQEMIESTYYDDLEQLQEVYDLKLIAEDEYQDKRIKIINRYHEAIAGLAENELSNMQEFGLQAARNLQNSFAQFLFDPFKEGLRGMAEGFVNTLRKMVAEAASAKILGAFMGMLSGSANPLLAGVGAAFGGTMDSGGRGSAGKAYLIGKGAQPEMFIPDSAGTFVPNADKMNGTSFNITVDARDPGAEGRIRAMIEQEMAPQIIEAAQGRTIASMRRPRFA